MWFLQVCIRTINWLCSFDKSLAKIFLPMLFAANPNLSRAYPDWDSCSFCELFNSKSFSFDCLVRKCQAVPQTRGRYLRNSKIYSWKTKHSEAVFGSTLWMVRPQLCHNVSKHDVRFTDSEPRSLAGVKTALLRHVISESHVAFSLSWFEHKRCCYLLRLSRWGRRWWGQFERCLEQTNPATSWSPRNPMSIFRTRTLNRCPAISDVLQSLGSGEIQESGWWRKIRAFKKLWRK